jgi:hypothetical protein
MFWVPAWTWCKNLVNYLLIQSLASRGHVMFFHKIPLKVWKSYLFLGWKKRCEYDEILHFLPV